MTYQDEGRRTRWKLWQNKHRSSRLLESRGWTVHVRIILSLSWGALYLKSRIKPFLFPVFYMQTLPICGSNSYKTQVYDCESLWTVRTNFFCERAEKITYPCHQHHPIILSNGMKNSSSWEHPQCHHNSSKSCQNRRDGNQLCSKAGVDRLGHKRRSRVVHIELRLR